MRKFTGFSLIELLVSMAIIGILLGLVGFGIATAQENARNSQRRQIVSDVGVALEDFYLRYNQYPSSITVSGSALSLTDGTNTATPAIDLSSGPVTASASETNAGATQFCYSPPSSTQASYSFAANLEGGGDPASIGEATACDPTTTSSFSVGGGGATT